MNYKQAQVGIMLLVFLLVVAGVAIYAYAKYSPSNQNSNYSLNTLQKTTSETIKVNELENGKDSGSASVKEFTVKGTSFAYSPETISVNKGDNVKISFEDDDGFHDFVVEGYGVATPRISTGQSATIEFTADKSGTFSYYCSVGSHKELGMVGQLIVN